MSANPAAPTTRSTVEIVQALFAAFGRGDIASVLAALSDDIEWSVAGPREVAYAGTRHGREQVAQFFQALGSSVEMLQFEPREFIAQGDQVAVIGAERLRVKATGRTVKNQWVILFTLRDGRVVRFREYGDTAALAAGFRP